jgi:diguanylate cyclase (GGDEF)-like protein
VGLADTVGDPQAELPTGPHPVDGAAAEQPTGPRPVEDNPAPKAPAARPKVRRVALLASRESSALKWGPKWLARFGFEVEVATNSDEMMTKLDETHPRVALLDIGWWPTAETSPSLAGVNEDPAVPVILLCTSERELREGLDSGAADVIRRPFDWRVLGRRADAFAHAFETELELVRTRSKLEDAWKEAESKAELLEHRSSTDSLTALPQRKTFEKTLSRALDANLRAGNGVAVLHLDIDRFKSINDSYGRSGGNELLKQIAQRLTSCVRSPSFIARQDNGLVTASLARLSGDEFIMMVGNVNQPDEVNPVAESILDSLSAPFVVAGAEVYATASIGATIAPADGDNAERLMQNAELATLESKRAGGSVHRFYNPSFNQLTKKNLELDRLLRKSLECHEFSLSYQPLVRVADGRIVGAEALLRWNHPELGRVPPLDFIPVAEETGLMVPIGAWVVRTACEELKSWIDAGLDGMRMSVNVALCQLLRGGLTEIVEGILRDIGVPPELLELELSERGVLQNSAEIMRQLNDLKALGVRLAVDDFGTGNSAIAYLKGFDLDVLKIDRSYMRGVPANEDDTAIASAMVAMAHKLRMTVVAEGIEHEEQLEVLRSWGCDEFQGFMVSPPVPSEEFRALIDANHSGLHEANEVGDPK